MKITDLDFDADPALGLKALKMGRLSQVVVIAGPNGAGKSRFFQKLSSTLQSKLSPEQLEATEQNIQAYRNAIREKQNKLDNIPANGSPDDERKRSNIERDLRSHNEQLTTHEVQLTTSNSITTDPAQSSTYSIINFSPTENTHLADSHTMAKNKLLQGSQTMDVLGTQNAAGAVLPLIQTIQNQWHEASHQNSSLPEDKKTKIINKYEKLVEFIDIFLGTKLDRDEDGEATLFGFRAGIAKLSEGQKLLLVFCTSLYSQESKLKDIIVWMDEPEKHLHPAALLHVIDKLTNVLTNGQLWMATHNINLLSHVPTSSIWYMEDGSVSYAGNKPERVLRGLLGDDEAISKLSHFMSLPEEMASNQFAFECLFSPQVVETGIDDPQTEQITTAINDLRANTETVKVLDFGAGKGRLLSTINELEASTEAETSTWLDYVAFDLSIDDEAICRSHIETTYETSTDRYFNNTQLLMETLPKQSVDIVILCNVFHEIDPREWPSLFDERSAIRYLLKPSGTLLIVEDQRLPYGEKAYSNGFLVLDKLQFQELFNITDYPHNDKRDGRLRAHRIPAESLGNVTAETRLSAIRSLQSASKENVKSIRSHVNPDFKTGQLYSFWSQQLTNSTLAIEEAHGSN